MLFLPLIATLAAADPAGHYDPLEVTARSTLFRGAADSAGVALQEREATAVTVAANIRALEVALDLLGERVASEEYDHLAALHERYNHEHAVLQAFVDTLSEDFEQVFSGAVERALAGVEGEVVLCPAFVTLGSSLPGLPKRQEPNTACNGEDLNDALAATVDGDPQLQADLAEIEGLAWPVVTLPSEPRAPLGRGERAVFVPSLIDAVAREALVAIDRHDAEQRLVFEAAIEQGSSKEELEALVDDAHVLTGATAAARAALADPILDAAMPVLDRWARQGDPRTAWCANPAPFGGCTVPDATADVVPRLARDKKVQKAARAD